MLKHPLLPSGFSLKELIKSFSTLMAQEEETTLSWLEELLQMSELLTRWSTKLDQSQSMYHLEKFSQFTRPPKSTCKTTSNLSSLLVKNTDQDHQEIGLQKDLTCKVSKQSLLRATRESIDQTCLVWVSFLSNLKTVKALKHSNLQETKPFQSFKMAHFLLTKLSRL